MRTALPLAMTLGVWSLSSCFDTSEFPDPNDESPTVSVVTRSLSMEEPDAADPDDATPALAQTPIMPPGDALAQGPASPGEEDSATALPAQSVALARSAELARDSACVVLGRVIDDQLYSRWENVGGTDYFRPRRVATIDVAECLKCSQTCQIGREPILVRYPAHSHSLRLRPDLDNVFFLDPSPDGDFAAHFDSTFSALPVENGRIKGLLISPRVIVDLGDSLQ
jgi:hypothetical protein